MTLGVQKIIHLQGAQQNGATPNQPEFLRLPSPGQRCPYTGLSRSATNELILPSSKNGNKPPVRSFVLRQPGARTGIRLIDYKSLADHIRRFEDVADSGGAE